MRIPGDLVDLDALKPYGASQQTSIENIGKYIIGAPWRRSPMHLILLFCTHTHDHGGGWQMDGRARRRKDAPKRGRPRRNSARRRKQLVVDVDLLERAMALTGHNQSETVNEALARMTENAAILEGFEEMRGAFPDHPDHGTAA